MAKDNKLLIGLVVALAGAAGVYYFVNRKGGKGPVITDGIVHTIAGKRYRMKYEHSQETGQVLRTSTELLKQSDPTLVVETPSDLVTYVEGTTKPGAELDLVIPSNSAGIRLASVQEVPVASLSGLLRV